MVDGAPTSIPVDSIARSERWVKDAGAAPSWRRLRPVMATWCLILVGSGCQSSYRTETAKVVDAFSAGAYRSAEKVSARQAGPASYDRGSGTDRVLWLYETGRAAQVAAGVESDPGRRSELIEQSVRAFDEAHALTVPYLDEEAEAKFGDAAAAIVLCPTVIPYRGWLCDRVMAGGLNAVNLLALRRFEDARVELNRSRDWQDDAAERFSDRREAAASAWRKGEGENVAKAAEVANSTLRRAELESLRADRRKKERDDAWNGGRSGWKERLADASPYPRHTNPFVDHLRGVAMLALSDGDRGDLDAARIWLEDAVESEPALEPVVKPDLDRIDALEGDSSSRRPPVVWIYFLAGLAPGLEEVKIPIPTPWATATIALPRPVASASPPSGFEVRIADAGGGGGRSPNAENAVPLAEIDRIVRSEFEAREPEIYAAQFANAAFYGTAQGLLNSWAAAAGGLRGLVAMYLLNATARYLTASADLRSWRTLPGRVELCRLELPVRDGNDGQQRPVTLEFSARAWDGRKRTIGEWRWDGSADYAIVAVTVPSLDAVETSKVSIVGATVPFGGRDGVAGSGDARVAAGGNPLANSGKGGLDLDYSLAFEGPLYEEAIEDLSGKLRDWLEQRMSSTSDPSDQEPLRVALDRSINDTSTRFAAERFFEKVVERCGWTIDDRNPEFLVGGSIRRQRLTEGRWREVEFTVKIDVTNPGTGQSAALVDPWTGSVGKRQSAIAEATPSPRRFARPSETRDSITAAPSTIHPAGLDRADASRRGGVPSWMPSRDPTPATGAGS
jgi:hypothetical protein